MHAHKREDDKGKIGPKDDVKVSCPRVSDALSEACNLTLTEHILKFVDRYVPAVVENKARL